MLPRDPPWWMVFDTELEDMRVIAETIMALYRPSSTPASPERLPEPSSSPSASFGCPLQSSPPSDCDDDGGERSSSGGPVAESRGAGAPTTAVAKAAAMAAGGGSSSSTSSLDLGRIAEMLTERSGVCGVEFVPMPTPGPPSAGRACEGADGDTKIARELLDGDMLQQQQPVQPNLQPQRQQQQLQRKQLQQKQKVGRWRAQQKKEHVEARTNGGNDSIPTKSDPDKAFRPFLCLGGLEVPLDFSEQQPSSTPVDNSAGETQHKKVGTVEWERELELERERRRYKEMLCPPISHPMTAWSRVWAPGADMLMARPLCPLGGAEMRGYDTVGRELSQGVQLTGNGSRAAPLESLTIADNLRDTAGERGRKHEQRRRKKLLRHRKSKRKVKDRIKEDKAKKKTKSGKRRRKRERLEKDDVGGKRGKQKGEGNTRQTILVSSGSSGSSGCGSYGSSCGSSCSASSRDGSESNHEVIGNS